MEEEDNQIKINKKSLKDDLKNIYINKRKKKSNGQNRRRTEWTWKRKVWTGVSSDTQLK